MHLKKVAIYLSIIFYLAMSHHVQATNASFPEKTLKIGVLAKLGKQACHDQWDLTATYLESKIPNLGFQIVCLDFGEMEEAIVRENIDFTILNSSFYVTLEHRHGISRIATLKNRTAFSSYTAFGGVIIYRSDRTDIKDAKDLKGKSFMAVDENSFGGWQVAWRYLKERQVDPYKDFSTLVFGERHDAVVMAVLNGVVDAGCVRTDTLERMATPGKIDLKDLAVLNPQERTPEFDFLRTTPLYPEWPIAKLRKTSEKLSKEVVIAMLEMDPESLAARRSNTRGWTIPLDYSDVHECLRILKLPPYEAYDKVSLGQLYNQYKVWIYFSAVILMCAFCGGSLVMVLNRRLKSTLTDLDAEHRKNELIMADLNEFKLTLEQTLDCVFMFHPETLKFFYANKGAVDQVGYNREELLNMTPLDLKPEYTEEQFRSMIDPLQESSSRSLTLVTKHRKKDGSLVPVEVFVRYIDPDRKNGRFVAIVRDITLRLQQETEKELLQSRLLHEQKMASVGQLAAGIAHEINTPAQYIGSNLDFLGESFADLSVLIENYVQAYDAAKNDRLSQQLIESFERAIEEADWPYLQEEIPQAIKQSIEGITQVSTIVLAMKNFAHPGPVEKSEADLNEIIHNTLTVSRSEWKLFVDPVLELDPQLPELPCVRSEIGQVFLNIILNSTHAIAEKIRDGGQGGKGQLTISSRHEGNEIVIKVVDSGNGISKENQKRIFDPFFTTKKVGEGSGQGLTIVYDIICNKHGGSLDVVSEEGVGTTMIIRLPIVPSSGDGAEVHCDGRSGSFC